MNIAVILAGGSGTRVGSDLPKQFLKIAGKMVIEHTLAVFQNHSEIDEIAIISNPLYVHKIEQICNKNCFTKVKKILLGGEFRYQSSLAAINAYQGNHNLLFHDAVRPLVNDRIISNCIAALGVYNAVDVAIKATDTIIQVDKKNAIESIPNRENLRNGQTPQAFKLLTIKEAYRLALLDSSFKTTDDCGVVKRYLPDECIFVVEGEVFNMKLTYKEDLFLFEKLFQLKSIQIYSQSLLAVTKRELKGKVIVIFGGSSGIGLSLVNICKNYGAFVYSFSRTQNFVDISDKEVVSKVLNDIYLKETRIDYVINTAGVLLKQSLVNMDYDDIFKSIQINYIGAVIIAKEAFPFLKQSKGSLLMFTSSSYTRGRSFYSLYSSSKAAIVNLVQALSEEWSDFDVRINCINPERTKTPMRISNFGAEPSNTLLDPNDVAIVATNVLISNMSGEIVDVKKRI